MHTSDDIADRMAVKMAKGEPVSTRIRLLLAAVAAVSSGMRNRVERYQEVRRMQAAEYLMRHLDKRMLRDVGYPRGETASTMVNTMDESEKIRARFAASFYDRRR